MKCGCYLLICRDQLVCARQLGARRENDRVSRICKFENDSYYLYRHFRSGDRGKNDHAYRKFPNLCTAVTTDDNISSYLTEAEMTMHIEFQNLCAACASIPCKLDFFFSFLVLTNDVKDTI